MLKRGFACVHTFADNRALVPDMLAQERAARVAERGIWRHPYYRIRAPDDAARHVGGFEVVEGRVVATARVSGRTFLNFGPGYKTDFTAGIAAPNRRAFSTAGVDPMALKDHRVRVRRWIKSSNGAMIEATHPEQIELLDE